MRIRLFIIVSALLLIPARSVNGSGSVQTLNDLRARLTAHLMQPRFAGALWAVKIVALDSGKTLFEHHPERLMSPASNTKLYTAALALDQLGPDYRTVTPIMATARPDACGRLAGSLVICGRGDPSWNRHRPGTNVLDLLQPIVAAVKRAGIRQISGDLIADTTFFHTAPTGSGWLADDLVNAEGAEVSALTLNENQTQIRVTPGEKSGVPCQLDIVDPLTGMCLDNDTITLPSGGDTNIFLRRFPGENVVHVFGTMPRGADPLLLDMPVLRPAEWFIKVLLAALQKEGIAVAGQARLVRWPDSPPPAPAPIAEVVSPPLRQLVRDFMKPSQNLECDLIFAHTGECLRDARLPDWRTSEQCALAALARFFETHHLPANEVCFDEGSGLSQNNLTTVNATVGLLRLMARHQAASAFMEALPVAGVDGTLQRRMKNPPALAKVWAKTGTLHWVNALSGYVTTQAGEKLVFSVMLNRYLPPPDRKRTEELDDIAVMLAGFNGRVDSE
jgi:serine-type D-Ala-D-Ala carboxypeptidase/endopeptidase (penicillin-binding protein 4)